MVTARQIEDKLRTAFDPSAIEVTDDSASHAGHAGSAGRSEGTHFTVRMVARRFAGQSRVARQRQVYEVLSAELADSVHALSLELRTPDEAERT